MPRPIIEKFDFGLLAEEDSDDGARFEKDAFFAIDPLDGTLQFSRGMAGFAVSIGLVSREGISLFGLVYDPIKEVVYHGIRGEGFFVNGKDEKIKSCPHERPQIFTDPSLKKRNPSFKNCRSISTLISLAVL